METQKKQINFEAIRSADPRIVDAPEIRIVYPSEAMVLKNEPAEPTTPPAEPVSTPVTAIPKENPEAAPAPGEPAKISLVDALRQNAGMFALIGLALLAIGFFIGKKQVL